MCLMAKGMVSDASGDDSNSHSIDELLDLIHVYQKVINKNIKKSIT